MTPSPQSWRTTSSSPSLFQESRRQRHKIRRRRASPRSYFRRTGRRRMDLLGPRQRYGYPFGAGRTYFRHLSQGTQG
ncbi:MAG: hypothetical protein MZV64_71165 [Ignavibacteriales bacterium]|nr:hypothetical protein [Ignavibacteriales bacterium]